VPHLLGATAGREKLLVMPRNFQIISKDNTLDHGFMKSSTIINFTDGKHGTLLEIND